MAAKKKSRITGMAIVEGSLVDEGDNPEAHIAMFKSGPDDEEDDVEGEPAVKAETINVPLTIKTTSQLLAERRFNEEFCEIRWAYEDAIYAAMSAPTSMIGALVTKSTDEFQAEVEALMTTVAKVSPSIAETIKTSFQEIRSTATSTDTKLATKTIANALDTIGAIGAEKKETAKMEPKTLAELMALLPAGHQDIVKSALDAAGKTAADELAVKAASDAKEVEAMKARLAKLEDERLDAEFKAKAEAIPGVDVEKTKTILKSAFARSKEEGEALEQTLRALGEQAKRGVSVKGIGSDQVIDANDDPEEKLKSIAADIRKAEPTLTEQQAFLKAFRSNRELANAATRG